MLVSLINRKLDIYYKGEKVGFKYEFRVGYPKGSKVLKRIDTDSEEVCVYLERKYKVQSGGKLTGSLSEAGTIITSMEHLSVEVSDKNELIPVLQEINRVYKRYEKAYLELAKVYDKLSYALVRRLKSKGIEVPYRDEVRFASDDLSVEIRFLGGYGNWISREDEDICDSESMMPSGYSKIEKIVKEFESEYKVRVSFSTGEKAWSYFEFEPKGLD